MDSKTLVKSFAEFAQARGLDRPTFINILEHVIKTMICRRFGVDDHFDVVINATEGDLQIWRFKRIVADNSEELAQPDTIGLSEAKKLESDFEIGEEVAEEISIASFGRREIAAAKQALLQKIKEINKDKLYEKYAQLVGDIVTAEVYQTLSREVILLDDHANELVLPRQEQIPKDRFRKGDYVRAVVHRVELQRSTPRIVLSRASPLFLERLFEAEVPEIADRIITIKKVVREPGLRAKVAVESYDDRIDPVGACVGMKGSRIHSVVRELHGESIDVIAYTDNTDLYISRVLSPAKLSSIQYTEEGRVAVYLKPEQVSLAIGKGGQNIKLASKLMEREIDVYRELDDEAHDIDVTELSGMVEDWIIDTLKRVGLDSIQSILALSREDLERRTDLELETIEELYSIIDGKLNES